MWGWCACWQEVIGARALAGAAGRTLLPRWLSSLAAWMNRRPPHAHLISHYSTWKVGRCRYVVMNFVKLVFYCSEYVFRGTIERTRIRGHV
jgi:hypothetical protein